MSLTPSPVYVIGTAAGALVLQGPVAAPSSLIATDAGQTTINLTWTVNSTDETGLRVERSPDASAWSVLANLPPATAAYSDQSCSPGTLYYYRVTALGALLSSAPSNTASATTDSPVPVVTGLTLNDLAHNAVYQRDIGGTSKVIGLTGTYTGGAPASIEAQILAVTGGGVVVDWTTITGGSIGAGNWSGGLTTPQGGAYTAKVRAGDSHGVIATGANQWNVGLVCGGAGQSNEVGNFVNTNGLPQAAAPGTYYYGSAFFDAVAGWQSVPAANGIRVLLNTMRALTGLPVAAVLGASGGQAIQSLSKGAGTGIYEAFIASVLSGPGKVEALFWDQGEGNANGGSPSTEPQYKALFDQLHGDYAADLGLTKATLPIFIGTLGTTSVTVVNPADNTTDATWSAIRSALANCAVEQTGVYVSHSNDDKGRKDEYHYNAFPDHEKIARQFAQSWAYHLGFVSNGLPAWFITGGAVVDGTHTTVVLTHSMGTDFTPTSGITGFEVSGDGGGTWAAPSAAVRTNATTITLTHGSLSTTNLRKVRYQYGMRASLAATAAQVVDNSSLANCLVYTHPLLSPTPLSSLPEAVYLQNNNYTGSGTTRTLAAQSVGAAGIDRLLVFAIESNDSASFANVTAVTCTPDVGAAGAATLVEGVTAAGGVPDLSLWQFLVPSTASTVSFSITFLHSPQVGSVSCWTIPVSLLNSTTKVGSAQATATAGTPTTLAPGTPLVSSAGGVIIMAARGQGTTGTATESGGDSWVERRDAAASGGRLALADAANVAGTNNPTLTFTTTSIGGSMVCACWR